MTSDQISQALTDLDGWEGDEASIHRRVDLDSFRASIAFVNRVADLAEAADHHPDLRISYDTVEVTLSTHSAGGVTTKDLDLARQVDAVA